MSAPALRAAALARLTCLEHVGRQAADAVELFHRRSLAAIQRSDCGQLRSGTLYHGFGRGLSRSTARLDTGTTFGRRGLLLLLGRCGLRQADRGSAADRGRRPGRLRAALLLGRRSASRCCAAAACRGRPDRPPASAGRSGAPAGRPMPASAMRCRRISRKSTRSRTGRAATTAARPARRSGSAECACSRNASTAPFIARTLHRRSNDHLHKPAVNA